MSQTPVTPNVASPSTPEDFAALKSLRAAQAEAIDAQTKLIASQMALQKAQAGVDPAAAQLDAATQAANLAAQQKSLADSESAVLKSRFDVPDSGYTGETKAGDKAGAIEAALLAAHALNSAAETIAQRIAPKAGKAVVLYGGSDLPDFQALIGFQAQAQAIDKALDEALGAMDGPLTKANNLLGPQYEFVTPAMIGEGMEAANKLLGFFRTDYTIQGVTVTPDDLLLINAVAGALTNRQVNVSVPALYNAPALLGDSAILATLDSLANKRVALQQKADVAVTTADSLTADAGTETDAQRKKERLDAAAGLKAVSDHAKGVLTLYDSLITKITTADEKAKLPLAGIIQQEGVRGALRDGANLMTVKISSAGGTYYTRKNLWSFFGAMPFYTMGGVVVHYSLFDGKTGFVLSAGTVPFNGGFYKVGRLPAL
ncbi:MAG TPA: hypothetical protein VGR96_12150 [Acidobacteriaceae bacterium]|nr:hypothetical protein [Acidobacteriaceae bacterium]